MMPADSPRKILAAAFLTCTLLAPALLFAADDNDLAAGITLARAGEYRRAIPLLRNAVATAPESADANYYLGLALNRTTPGKEAESFLKHSLMENPENLAVNFELGLHYFEKEVPAEAVDYFEEVIRLAPLSEQATYAKQYLRRIEEHKQEKNWELTLFVGGQYDTNVILNGKSMPLPAGYSGKSDWSALLNLRGSYTPLKTAETEAGVSYSFYQSLHSSLKSFDIMQNLLEVSGSRALTPDLRLKGTYSYEYLLLNGSAYDSAHSLAPSLLFRSDFGITTLDYRYRNTLYRNSEQFATNTQRNGDNQLLGINQIMTLSESSAVWALYTHDSERTKKSEWDYQGDRLLLGLRSALPFGLMADVSGEIYWKTYRAEDPLYLLTRHDTQYTASLSLAKNFSENYSLSLSEVFSHNVCNIPDFAYDRSVTSLLFNARF